MDTDKLEGTTTPRTRPPATTLNIPGKLQSVLALKFLSMPSLIHTFAPAKLVRYD
jgi:hypothetical protein